MGSPALHDCCTWPFESEQMPSNINTNIKARFISNRNFKGLLFANILIFSQRYIILTYIFYTYTKKSHPRNIARVAHTRAVSTHRP